MAESADIFAYVTGAIALMMIVFKALRSQLPSSRIKALVEILEDTDALLSSSISDGLVSPNLVPVFMRALTTQKEQKDSLHAEVRALSSIADEMLALKQLSWKIFGACANATRLRADIATHSQKERTRLAQASEHHLQHTATPHAEQRPVAKSTGETALSLSIFSRIASFVSGLRTPSPLPAKCASFDTSRSILPASTLVDSGELCAPFLPPPPPCASFDRRGSEPRPSRFSF